MKKLSIKAAIAKLEEANIQVSEYKEKGKLCGYELNTYTDAGVNMILFLDFRADGKNIKDPKEFIAEYNQRVNDIDIDEDLRLHLEDKRYRQEIGATIGAKDFAEWKENLKGIFAKTSKTAEQRQFEQVVDKFRSQIAAMEELLKLMPVKDNVSEGCQRTYIATQISNLDYAINGITLEDFTPNEYSGDFKLSYS